MYLMSSPACDLIEKYRNSADKTISLVKIIENDANNMIVCHSAINQ